MINDDLLLFYYPCTWMFVDDQERFLESIDLVAPRNRHMVYVDGAASARKQVAAVAERESWTKSLVRSAQINGDLATVTHLGSILHHVGRRSRFDELAVIVCDYAMPGMDGITFLASVDQPSIKKVLLTGVADENTAINAFNEGVIDRFVLKNEQSAIDQTFEYASLLECARFSSIQEIFWRQLGEGVKALRASSEAREHLAQFVGQYQLVEYYYSMSPHGFIGFDATGKAHFLLMYHASQQVELIEDFRRQGAPQGVLDAVAANESYPVFVGETSATASDRQWKECLIKVQQSSSVSDLFVAECGVMVVNLLNIPETSWSSARR